MFERFTREARQLVVGAQTECRLLGHERIETVHLLLSMAAQSQDAGVDPAAGALREHGIEPEALRMRVRRLTDLGPASLDSEALAAIGIDIERVRETVEATFGSGALDHGRSRKGHIPFSPQAKKVLELSLREAIALKHRAINGGHILLGLLRATANDDTALRVLADAGVDSAALRATTTRMIRTAAA